MNKAFLTICAMACVLAAGLILFLSGCASFDMSEYKKLEPTQLVDLVECKTTVPKAKANLEAAGYSLAVAQPDMIVTDWKHSNHPYWTELWPDGVWLKYKIVQKPGGRIEWSEIRSSRRTDEDSITNDFYAGEKTFARQNEVRKMICGVGLELPKPQTQTTGSGN